MKHLLKYNFIRSGKGPLEAHLIHLRHLTKPVSLKAILAENHNVSKSVALKLAQEISPFIHQALMFHEVSKKSPLHIRPVPLYYSYLNFAVAIVKLYKPKNWEQFRSHGAKDKTKSIKNISLKTKAVKLSYGAIPLFHSILTDSALPKNIIDIETLLSSIPMITSELTEFFNVNLMGLKVTPSIVTEEGAYKKSQVTFQFEKTDHFPIRRLNKLIPALKENYILFKKNGLTRIYRSKQKWSLANKERADRFHDQQCLKMINYGYFEFDYENRIYHCWKISNSKHILPALSASLIFSFVLSSLSRYRANLLHEMSNSKLNLLFEVFTHEADSYMIPAFRNLLYGKTVFISENHFI